MSRGNDERGESEEKEWIAFWVKMSAKKLNKNFQRRKILLVKHSNFFFLLSLFSALRSIIFNFLTLFLWRQRGFLLVIFCVLLDLSFFSAFKKKKILSETQLGYLKKNNFNNGGMLYLIMINILPSYGKKLYENIYSSFLFYSRYDCFSFLWLEEEWVIVWTTFYGFSIRFFLSFFPSKCGLKNGRKFFRSVFLAQENEFKE